MEGKVGKQVGKQLEKSWKTVEKKLNKVWEKLEKSWKKVGEKLEKSWGKVGQVLEKIKKLIKKSYSSCYQKLSSSPKPPSSKSWLLSPHTCRFLKRSSPNQLKNGAGEPLYWLWFLLDPAGALYTMVPHYFHYIHNDDLHPDFEVFNIYADNFIYSFLFDTFLSVWIIYMREWQKREHYTCQSAPTSLGPTYVILLSLPVSVSDTDIKTIWLILEEAT